MSLINEALKRADAIGQSAETPLRSVKHLYDEDIPADSGPSGTAAEEDPSSPLRRKQTSLAGAAVLGFCVVAAVGMIMYLTLPEDQRGPVEAEAGGVTADLPEAQTPPGDEEHRTTPDKATAPPAIASLQQSLTVAQPTETTPPSEPAAKDEQEPEAPKAVGQLTLSGILASDGKGYAIINNQMLAVGDNIDGARVVTIGKRHVVLEKDGKQFVVRM